MEEDDIERKRRLNREKKERWRTKRREQELRKSCIDTIPKGESSNSHFLLDEDDIERRRRVNREKKQRWRTKRREQELKKSAPVVLQHSQELTDPHSASTVFLVTLLPHPVELSLNDSHPSSHKSNLLDSHNIIKTLEEGESERRRRLNREKQKRFRTKRREQEMIKSRMDVRSGGESSYSGHSLVQASTVLPTLLQHPQPSLTNFSDVLQTLQHSEDPSLTGTDPHAMLQKSNGLDLHITTVEEDASERRRRLNREKKKRWRIKHGKQDLAKSHLDIKPDSESSHSPQALLHSSTALQTLLRQTERAMHKTAQELAFCQQKSGKISDILRKMDTYSSGTCTQLPNGEYRIDFVKKEPDWDHLSASDHHGRFHDDSLLQLCNTCPSCDLIFSSKRALVLHSLRWHMAHINVFPIYETEQWKMCDNKRYSVDSFIDVKRENDSGAVCRTECSLFNMMQYVTHSHESDATSDYEPSLISELGDINVDCKHDDDATEDVQVPQEVAVDVKPHLYKRSHPKTNSKRGLLKCALPLDTALRIRHACVLCEKEFNSLRYLHYHIFKTHQFRVRDKSSSCTKCRDVIESADLLSSHRLLCLADSQPLPSETILQNHAVYSDDSVERADVEHQELRETHCSQQRRCSKTNNSKKNDGSEKIYRVHPCTVCEKSYKDSKALWRHMQHHQGFKCPGCDTRFDSKAALSSHELKCTIHRDEKKRLKSRQESTIVNVKQSSELATHAGDKGKRMCNLCNKSFCDSKGLRRHMLAAHQPSSRPSNCCTICGRKIYSAAYLRVHEAIHRGELPYECKTCKKSFASKWAQLSHMETAHGIVQLKHLCTVCGKRLMTPKDLRRHMCTHTGEMPHTCAKCGEGFRVWGHLHNHRETCLTEMEKEASARLSQPYRILRLLRLAKFVRISAKLGLKPENISIAIFFQPIGLPLQRILGRTSGAKETSTDRKNKPGSNKFAQKTCEICGKRISYYGMPDHMKRHAGVLPFSCETCGKQFNRKCNLATHQLTHTDINIRSIQPSPRLSDDGVGSFVCSICDKTFKFKWNLKVHLLTHAKQNALPQREDQMGPLYEND